MDSKHAQHAHVRFTTLKGSPARFPNAGPRPDPADQDVDFLGVPAVLNGYERIPDILVGVLSRRELSLADLARDNEHALRERAELRGTTGFGGR